MGKRRHLSDIGSNVPQNLKFGILVMIAIFWADVLRSFLTDLLGFPGPESTTGVNLVIAIIITIGGFVILLVYRKIVNLLDKIKF